jgi:nicotinamide riboside kinase
MAKIGFTGSVSVGKTTLVNALKQLPEFDGYVFATERSKYLRDLGIPLNTDSTIKGQIVFMAERSSELLHPSIITDRTIIDVIAFTELSKSIPFYQKVDFRNLAYNLISEYDYIFYISPDGVDIEDNGVRTIDPVYRMAIDNEIRNICRKHLTQMKNYAELTGSVDDRVQKVKQTLFPTYL